MSNLGNLCRKAILIAGVSAVALTSAACANTSLGNAAYLQEETTKDDKKIEKRRIKVLSAGKSDNETKIVINDGNETTTIEGKDIKIEDGKIIVDGKVVKEGDFASDGQLVIKDGVIKLLRDGEAEEIILKGQNWKFKGDDFKFDFDFDFDGIAEAFSEDGGEGFVLDLGDLGRGKVFQFYGQNEAIEDMEEALAEVEDELADAENDIEREALTSARDSLKSALENMKERRNNVFALRKNAQSWSKDLNKTLKQALKELEGKRIKIDGARVIMREELEGAREDIMEALNDITAEVEIDEDGEEVRRLRVRFLEDALGNLENLEERHLRSLERAEERLEREQERLEHKKERLEERRKQLEERLKERKAAREKREKKTEKNEKEEKSK